MAQARTSSRLMALITGARCSGVATSRACGAVLIIAHAIGSFVGGWIRDTLRIVLALDGAFISGNAIAIDFTITRILTDEIGLLCLLICREDFIMF